MSGPVLDVRDLHVSFAGTEGPDVHAVRGLSYALTRGEVLGIVGESGSGKSVSALAVMGLLPKRARTFGTVLLHGTDVLRLGDRQLSAVRGKTISMIFQEPLSALTPVYTVGDQVAEAVRAHRDVPKEIARRQAVDLLALVGIPQPAVRAKAFPHEFSGGMRQRVMIAMAIANDPDVILADEPTTALDVTIQAQILEVLKTVRQATGAAIVLITHDLGMVAGFADRVLVMYAGRAVEVGTVDEVYARPRMPYTMGLLGSIPRLDATTRAPLVPIKGSPPSLAALPSGCPFRPRCPLAVDTCVDTEPTLASVGPVGHRAACHLSGRVDAENLQPGDVFPVPRHEELPRPPRGKDRRVVLAVTDLVKHHPLRKGAVVKRQVGTVRAVDGVNFDIRQGETLGLVGESGSGKTTTLLQVIELVAPQRGRVVVLDQDVSRLPHQQRMTLRRDVQVVFQDPLASLDPRMPIGDILAEPLHAHHYPRARIAARVPELLRLVGLEPGHASRYPQEFSGGQRQRIAIARALALEPKLVLLDEPVSALDVSIRAGILNLLQQLKARLSLSYLFVAHDLSVVRHMADRVAVMYLGRIVELGDVDSVYATPAHPYTQALLSAIPVPDPHRERTRRRILLKGEMPNPVAAPSGCRFRTRCPTFAALSDAERRPCLEREPSLDPIAGDQRAACHYARRMVVV